MLLRVDRRVAVPAGGGAVLGGVGWWGAWPATSPTPAPVVHPDQAAYVMYTSGSTGGPKGVVATHRGVTRLVHRVDYVALGPGQTHLLLAPLAFDASTFELWGALLTGGRLVIGPAAPASLEQIAAALRTHGVTTLWLTAALFQRMVAEQAEALGAVDQLLAGGEALPVAAVRRLRAERPGCRLINGYGPTENTTFSATYTVPAEPDEGTAGVPIGRTIGGTTAYVLDGRGQLQPSAWRSELYMGGAGLARGYLGRPGLTAERFVPDPFGGRGRGCTGPATGCGGCPTAGLEFLGRLDDQVKLRGYRIELGEVEAAVARHPAVRAAAVGARPGPDGQAQLVCWYVAKEDPGVEALRAHVRGRLPEAMVPSRWVCLPALPLTPNGKLDRRALPNPEATRPELAAAYEPPGDELERTLAAIWQEVLGLERVGRHDNFFDLGGHSLKATQVVSRVNQVFGLDMPIRTIFTEASIASLGRAVRQTAGTRDGVVRRPIMPLPEQAAYSLSHAQKRVWFLHQLDPESAEYNMAVALAVEGELDFVALEAALHALAERHPSLRTRFPERDGEPVQVIGAADEIALAFEDLSVLPPAPRERVRQVARDEAHAPFNLAQDLPCRVRLLRRAPTTMSYSSRCITSSPTAGRWTCSWARSPSLTPQRVPVRCRGGRRCRWRYVDYVAWQDAEIRAGLAASEVYWLRT